MRKKAILHLASILTFSLMALTNNNIPSLEGIMKHETAVNEIQIQALSNVQIKVQTKQITKGATKKLEGVKLDNNIQEFIYEESEKNGQDALLVMAVIKQESDYNIKCISDDGQDYGLMQIRELNHDRINKHFGYELDYLNPYDNIKAGIFMLKENMDIWKSSGIQCVLMSYNMGSAGANKLFKKGIYSSEYSRRITSEYDRLKGSDKE